MVAPLLRFTEFTDDWEETTLENLAEVERGKFSVRPRNDPRYFDGEMPFVQTGDVAGSDMYLKGYSQTLNADGIKVSKVFPADTILITIAANIGDTTITRYAVACPDSVVAIQSKKDKANTIFLKNLIDLQKEVLDSQATQNAQKNINLQVLKPLELFAPSIEEQTKIASFLSNVDEKISQLTQKHQLLSQYKQGMMQKLFSQQVRFKADDGSEFGEWENKPLSELSEKAMYGMNASATEYDGLNKYLRITDICEISHKLKRDNLTSPNAELEEKYKLGYGDLLFARTGASVGKSYLYSVDDGIAYFAGFLIKFSLKLDLVNPYFLFAQTLTLDFDKWVITNSMRSGQPGINAEEYSSYIFKVPCLEEQTKIANFLSAIDQKIEVVAQQIEQAKLWKKGLLQQMFV